MHRQLLVAAFLSFSLVACSSSKPKEDKPAETDGTAPVASPAAPSGDNTTAPAVAAAHPAPFNPYASAAPGDWVCMVVRATYDGDAGTIAYPAISVWTWTVEDSTNDDNADVKKSTQPSIADVDGKSHGFPRKGTLNVDGAGGIVGSFEQPAVDASFGDEINTIGDKEFNCKKVTLATPNEDIKAVVWFSPEVKVNGLVALTQTVLLDKEKNLHETLEFEVAGFGTKDGTVVWGKKPDEVAAAVLKPEPPK
jgi:hypothetical protein